MKNGFRFEHLTPASGHDEHGHHMPHEMLNHQFVLTMSQAQA